MKKIALLGATGYIGRSLAPEFFAEKNKYELFLFSRSKDKLKKMFPRVDDANVHACEMQDFLVHAYDVIINCTGIGDTQELKARPEQIFRVTEEMDAMIMGYLEKKPSTLYINLSSGAVYGDNFKKPTTMESVSVLHVNALPVSEYYAIAKINAEAKHRARPNLNIVDVRVFAFFSRFVDTASNFLMSDIVQSLQGETVLETTDENIVRDYICPKDLHALLQLIIKKRKINDCFDVYSLKPVKKFALLALVQKKYGLKYIIKERAAHSAGLPKKAYYSNNRKAASLGYAPKFSSLSGIDAELRALKDSLNF
jgi:nucleoside-diphosphate-sugar epimerase